MANRGRPKKEGVKPGWTLFRSFLVLHAYNEARAKGDKHAAAITESVSAVRSRAPGMKISESEVKRVLAEFQSKDSDGSWIITEGVAHGPELALWLDNLECLAAIARRSRGKLKVSIPDGKFQSRVLKMWTIQVGPRPHYPRSNAMSSATR
jgi:hypothetical protein